MPIILMKSCLAFQKPNLLVRMKTVFLVVQQHLFKLALAVLFLITMKYFQSVTL